MAVKSARVSKSGRIVLPAEFRKAVGLDRGGDVVVELEGNEIRIKSIEQAVSRAQVLTRELLGGRPGASVDAFLGERAVAHLRGRGDVAISTDAIMALTRKP